MTGNYFDLGNKRALILGGTSGIGLAVGQRFVEAGATVVVTGRSRRDGVDASGCHYISADVSDEASVAGAVGQAVDYLGGLDIALVNAGISLDDNAGVAELATEDFDLQVQTNLRGAYLGLKYVAQHISDYGSIILTTSGAADFLFPGYLGYGASKAGLPVLARHAAGQLGGRGIRVNCISPGTILTAIQPADDPEARICAQHTCLGRVGSTNDVIGAYHFLASDESRYVTATELVVDGGWAGGVTERSMQSILEQANKGNADGLE